MKTNLNVRLFKFAALGSLLYTLHVVCAADQDPWGTWREQALIEPEFREALKGPSLISGPVDTFEDFLVDVTLNRLDEIQRILRLQPEYLMEPTP